MAVDAALADIARRAAAGAITGNVILKTGAGVISGELMSRGEFARQGARWDTPLIGDASQLYLKNAMLHHGSQASGLGFWCGPLEEVLSYALVGRDWELGPYGAPLVVRMRHEAQ